MAHVSSNPAPSTIAGLLPKLNDTDPDYRFMALTDIFHALTIGKQDFLYNDYNVAARTVDGILKCLDDGNGEVQNLAVKCLTPLTEKIPGTVLCPLFDKLCTLKLKNAVDNSIPSLALKVVVVTLRRPVAGVPPPSEVENNYDAISKVIIPRLVGRIVMPIKQLMGHEIQLPEAPPGIFDVESDKAFDSDMVDVLIEVVRCFGPMLRQPEVEALQETVVKILQAERPSAIIKKRCVVAASILALYLTSENLSNFVSQIITSFQDPRITPVQRRLYINILGSMARSIPHRFGPYLKILGPFVLSALSEKELAGQLENSAEDGERDPELDDVREAALVALEAFLAACGLEMRVFTEESIAAALRFLKYDPNYADDGDEDMDNSQSDDDMGDFEDDEFEADAGFDDDDDDASWKVRRCAAKVLYTLISTRGTGDLLEDGTLYTQIAPVLVQRFNEREENVRLEVIATMSSLIRKTGEGVVIEASQDEVPAYTQPPQSRKRRRASSDVETNVLSSSSAGLVSPAAEPLPAFGPRVDLAELAPALVKVSVKLLKSSTIPTKQALIDLLTDAVSVQKGGMSEYFGQLVGPLIDAVKSQSGFSSSSTIASGGAASATASTLRIAALKLLGDFAKTHSSTVLQPYLSVIIPVIVSAANDKFYKISGQAIGTIEEFVKALTPPRSSWSGQDQRSDLQKLYQVLVGRISANDADLEVRQRAIQALGILIARTFDPDGKTLLSSQDRSAALDLLCDRLRNETTRLAAVRAIENIAMLINGQDQLQPAWLRAVALELSAQLRKADRSLRGSSLAALKSLVLTPAARTSLDAQTVQGLVSALIPLINAADLHLLSPALSVLSTLVLDKKDIVVTESLNTALCGLLVSTISGSVLESLLNLVTNIGEQGMGQPLMTGLLQEVSVKGDSAVVGKVIGALLVAGAPSVGVNVQSFLSELATAVDDSRRCLALAVLGEAGLRLGKNSTLKPSVFTAQFNSASEKVPLAAAIALGRAGAGNIPAYLPEILRSMQAGTFQYLLLHSTKEILQHAANTSTDISKYSKQIWDKLVEASQNEDNKAVGAECIGRLVIIDPKVYMPQLKLYLTDAKPSVRALAISAVRYTLPDDDETFDGVLKTTLIEMLDIMLADTELENKRLALTTMNSAAHNKPEIINPSLNRLLPSVMKDSVIRPELIREVMMGPFKHKVDDGLEIRKSAYETLYSLMETAFARINVLEFFDRVLAGLKDEHDIRALCNLMLTKLVILDKDETTRRLDPIADCFRSILSVKLKETAVKQEVERQDEAIKSTVRVTLLLNRAIPAAASAVGPQAGQHQVWQTYWEWIEKEWANTLENLREDNKGGI